MTGICINWHSNLEILHLLFSIGVKIIVGATFDRMADRMNTDCLLQTKNGMGSPTKQCLWEPSQVVQYHYWRFEYYIQGKLIIKELTVIVNDGDIGCCWVEDDTFIHGAQQEMEGFIILHQCITYEGDVCALLTLSNTSLWHCE